MAFKNLFKETTVEPVEPAVDPVVEQRRKEKFSTPLIYSDEFEETIEKVEKTVTSQPTTPVASTAPVTSPTKRTTNVRGVRPRMEPGYQMSEVISPIYGRKEEPAASKTNATGGTKKRVIQKPIEDQIVPVISPMYGAYVTVEDEPEEKEPVSRRSQKKQAPAKAPETVTEDLRNIANIIQEEENQLKLVEKRTGEFQFDFSNMKSEEPSLIDEIDDAMTLDELMSLYEKKFKDEE